MLQPGTRKAVIGAIAVLFGLSMWMGHKLSIKHQEYEQTPDSKTPFQALAPALLGFRQVAASLLWVKTDDYFHEGQYEPILRMVRHPGERAAMGRRLKQDIVAFHPDRVCAMIAAEARRTLEQP